MRNTLFLIGLILIFSCKEPKNTKVYTGENVFNDLVNLEGKSFDTTSLKGKKVLVNFWATWCAPCKNEMPDLLEVQKILTKENYVFLLISDESTAQILEFKRETKYDFTFLKSTKPTSSLGIYALPTTFIYNEKGEMVDKIIGAVEWNSEKMIHKLKNIK